MCLFRRAPALGDIPGHEFWPDNVSYRDIPGIRVIGHRQVTDAYMAHLASSYSARLATFDQTLAKLPPTLPI